MEEEKLIDSIRPLAQQLMELHQIQLDWARREVDMIVNKGIKDIPRIEQAAEVLLESEVFGNGLEDFRAFMRYIWLQVDKVMAGEYILLYKEWSEEMEDE